MFACSCSWTGTKTTDSVFILLQISWIFCFVFVVGNHNWSLSWDQYLPQSINICDMKHVKVAFLFTWICFMMIFRCLYVSMYMEMPHSSLWFCWNDASAQQPYCSGVIRCPNAHASVEAEVWWSSAHLCLHIYDWDEGLATIHTQVIFWLWFDLLKKFFFADFCSTNERKVKTKKNDPQIKCFIWYFKAGNPHFNLTQVLVTLTETNSGLCKVKKKCVKCVWSSAATHSNR